MSKLSDLTFEGGSLPTGVTSATSGTGTATLPTPGLVGGSNNKGRVTMPVSSSAYFLMNFASMSGGSVGLTRGVGGYVKVTAENAGNSGTTRLVRLSGNADAQFLATVQWSNSAWVISYLATTLSLPTAVNPGDGNPHSFYFAYHCDSTVNRGWVALWWDGELQAFLVFDNSAVSFGTGVSHARLGDHVGGAAQSLTAEFDGIYLADSISQEVSAEGGFTGYSGTPIVAANATVQLTTSAGSPTWTSDDTNVMTVSSGLVTLQQAAGGVAVIKDATGSARRIEFAPRTIAWSMGARSISGSTFTSPVTLTSVSDGVTTYTDLWPSIVGVNCRLTGISGTVPNLTATFTTAGFSGVPQAYVTGVLKAFALPSLWDQKLSSMTAMGI